MRATSKILLLAFLLLAPFVLVAKGGFSYVYIQGDKNVPFYVKFEDQMLPRYGKNYSIIPQLAPGVINVQILFQQNIYPPQKFAISVPENGFRGFLLMRKNNAFTLYDIQQQFYLQEGNRPEDDQAPTEANAFVYTSAKGAEVLENTTEPLGENTPKFLSNVELKNDRVVQPTETAIEKPVGNRPKIIGKTTEPVTEIKADNSLPMRNSDCPTPMEAGEFDDLYRKVEGKSENIKLKFLLSKMEYCFTTAQARILAKALDNDPERYTFLKRVFPRVTDQANFPMLESLLTTQEWKSYFQLIIP